MTKMKAVVASKFGNPDDVLTVSDTVDKPEADDKTLLIKVHACSLSPGDYRALLGDKTIVANPKVWPYIPGGDVCGTVESVPESCSDEFKVGDKVVATWDMYGVGGLGQYTKVNPKKTVKLPKGLTVEEGAALANTASHALLVLNKANIQESERVLLLGGSGGLGTLLVQMLKTKKVSYLATTSTDEALMKELGADKVVDYTKKNWWELKDWKNEKFDCIIDVAEGKRGWKNASNVLKKGRAGGRFVAVVFQDWHIDGTHIYQVFGMLLPPFGRQLFNMVRWSTPYYRVYLNEPTKETMTEMLEKAADKEFRTVLDPESPHAFTAEGARDAWNKHIARKGHGKIVISVE
eukprot:CAMPEP_0119012636 /NCGR_PEP_ID=MMETSP1176-20130426/7108_1 /TAXON_ID=265551 /ORGANISM="Synedropsis recta cf, Strain CCMP1620" /LENGTH=348 /DNA_ID=CAMNT_0006965633 /DNA_START=90 /DNA_END=1136 /DNA_ORIENTATION=-